MKKVESDTESDFYDVIQENEEAKPEVKQKKSISMTNDVSQDSKKQNNGEKSKGYISYPILWIDLEMTGLDIETDQIIEIASILTDGHLRKKIMGPSLAINWDKTVFDSMNDWCIEHHNKSGLVQRCLDSKYNLKDAEDQTLEFLQEHVPQQKVVRLGGSTVHMDKFFMMKHMPRLVNYLHYRIIDVSSIKELCMRWYPTQYHEAPRKVMAHTALSDIEETIEELKYYRRTIFIKSQPRQSQSNSDSYAKSQLSNEVEQLTIKKQPSNNKQSSSKKDKNSQKSPDSSKPQIQQKKQVDDLAFSKVSDGAKQKTSQPKESSKPKSNSDKNIFSVLMGMD